MQRAAHDDDPGFLTLDPDGASLECEPGVPEPALRTFLEGRRRESVVLLPLLSAKRFARLTRKVERTRGGDPRENALERGLEQARQKLPTHRPDGTPIEWHPASVRGRARPDAQDDADAPTIPAVYAFDLRRPNARRAAERLGLRRFHWCATDTFESFGVEPLDDDEPFEWKDVRERAELGWRDMVSAASELSSIRAALPAGASDRRRLVLGAGVSGLLALLVLVAGIAGGAGTLGPLVHPLWCIVPLAVALWHRGHAGARRELDGQEAAVAWNLASPRVFGTWLFAILVLALAGTGVSLAETGSTVGGSFGRLASQSVVALWLLTPLVWARDRVAAFGALGESTLTFGVAWFVLGVTRVVARIVLAIVWEIAEGFVPFTIPAVVIEVVDAITRVSATGLPFAVYAGYVWERNREFFGRWATKESSAERTSDA